MTSSESSKGRYHHGDLHAALVDVALRQVAAEGAERFSLREAAREVGVSANAAYRHFADKTSLLATVSSRGFGMLSERMTQAAAAISADRKDAAEKRLRAVGRAYVEFALEQPQLFRLMFGASGRLPEDAPRARPTPFEVLTSALDAMVKSGVLPRRRRGGAELKAWTAVHGFAALAIEGVGDLGSEPERAAALESVLDFTIDGICGR